MQYCDLFLLPPLYHSNVTYDGLSSSSHVIAQKWLDLRLQQNIFSSVKTLQHLNLLESWETETGEEGLPDRERGKKSWRPLIGGNKNSSFNSAEDKLRTYISIQMRMQAPFNSKSVLPVLYFITTTNMDGIIITKECLNLWTWIWSDIDPSMQINVYFRENIAAKSLTQQLEHGETD